AAEMVVPDARAQERSLRDLRGRLARAIRVHLAEDIATVATLRSQFAHYRLTIAEHEQRVDDMAQRIEQAVLRGQARRRADVERLHRRLAARHPRVVIANARASLGPLEVRLAGALRARVVHARASLAERMAALDAMSPLGVLARGYAIATTEGGRAVRAPSEVAAGQKLSIRVHRGTFSAKVDGTQTSDAPENGSVLEEHS
ncbi:MAG TPA: exodeoxyribonuclease VII large subunit, partial [Polyangiaceae bacterium]